MEYRVPPHSIEAEEAILGAILIDSKVLNKCNTLDTEDFYDKQNGEIFSAIKSLANSNKPVDIVTVSDEVGNIEYLAKLANGVPTTANVKHYVNIVRGKSIRRQYIRASADIASLAYEGEYANIIDFRNDVLSKIDIDLKQDISKQVKVNDILQDVLSTIEKRYSNIDEATLKYGLKWLDDRTGGIRNELTYIAARPSIGKSAFASQIAINLCKNKYRVAMFNLEMDKEQLTERLISNIAGIDLNKIRNPKNMNESDWQKLVVASGILSNMKLKIYDDVFKIEEIRSIAKELKLSNELDFVIIDYLQLCDTAKKTNSANERVSYLSRQMKLMQKELRIPVWCLSQLSRTNEKDNRRPKLIDLRDSGSIEQDKL